MFPSVPAQAAEAGLTMAAVLRHLVSGAAMTAGLPRLPAPEDNGPLPGSVGGIPRPAVATLSDAEWAALAGDDADEDDDDEEDEVQEAVAAGEDDQDEEGEEGSEGEYVDDDESYVSAVERIPDDMLLSWEDLKDLPVKFLTTAHMPPLALRAVPGPKCPMLGWPLHEEHQCVHDTCKAPRPER